MPNLLPFRDYDEHDVINLFAYDGTSVNKGSLVKVMSTNGWEATDEMELGNPVSETVYGNTVSQRYAIAALVDTSPVVRVSDDEAGEHRAPDGPS